MKSSNPVPVIALVPPLNTNEGLDLHRLQAPRVIKGLDIGPCVRNWSPDYLKSKGQGKLVKVHKSNKARLNFRHKNFTYETIYFSDLVDYCSTSQESIHRITGDKSDRSFWYLRSLGDDPRGRDVSDLSKHFPELYADLKIPPLFPTDSFFSSVFRITSPGLQLWTHYDTCHNVLIQVRGKKRVVFFPPSEALNLYLDGDKSQVLDIDKPDVNQYPKFLEVERYETVLDEGDAVFIPALWFHNITALDFSVSVNVFWKNLDHGLYDKKDTYGNKDHIPAQLETSNGQIPPPPPSVPPPITPAPDNNTCTGVVSNIFRRQLRRILICMRQLNLRAGHHCVLKCTMILEKVLTKEGKVEQKLLDDFSQRFPEFMQPRVNDYIEKCRLIAGSKINHKEESCRSYEPLSRCITDAVFNAFRTLDKAASQLKNLPKVYEDFYLRRMIISLQNRLEKLSGTTSDEILTDQTSSTDEQTSS